MARGRLLASSIPASVAHDHNPSAVCAPHAFCQIESELKRRDRDLLGRSEREACPSGCRCALPLAPRVWMIPSISGLPGPGGPRR
jgi:hypothetical protein